MTRKTEPRDPAKPVLLALYLVWRTAPWQPTRDRGGGVGPAGPRRRGFPARACGRGAI